MIIEGQSIGVVQNYTERERNAVNAYLSMRKHLRRARELSYDDRTRSLYERILQTLEFERGVTYNQLSRLIYKYDDVESVFNAISNKEDDGCD